MNDSEIVEMAKRMVWLSKRLRNPYFPWHSSGITQTDAKYEHNGLVDQLIVEFSAREHAKQVDVMTLLSGGG